MDYRILKSVYVPTHSRNLLTEKLVEIVLDRTCNMVEEAEKCITLNTLYGELERVLRDNRLDYFESVFFYDLVKSYAGDDYILQPEDVKEKDIASDLPKIGDKKLSSAMGSEAVDVFKDVPKDKYVDSFFKIGDDDHPTLFAPADAYRKKVVLQFSLAKLNLDQDIDYIERYVAILREQDQKLGNRFTPEEWLGVSSYLYYYPNSHVELNGAENVLRHLYVMRAGLEIYLSKLKNKVSPDTNNKSVKKFLDGPFVKYAYMNICANCGKVHDHKEELPFKRKFVQMLQSEGAERLAGMYCETFTLGVSKEDAEYISAPLGNFAYRWINEKLTPTANIAIGADDIAVMAVGGTIFYYLGKSLKGAKYGAAINNAVIRNPVTRYGRYLLPGGMFCETDFKSGGLLRKAGSAVLSYAVEFWKIQAYLGGARSAGADDDTIDWLARGLMFVAGANAAFGPTWRRTLAKEIEAGRTQGLFDDLANLPIKSLRVKNPDLLLAELEFYGHVTPKDAGRLWKERGRELTRRKKVKGKAAQAKRDLRQAIRECEKLATRNPKKLGKDWIEDARRLFSDGELSKLRGHLQRGREIVKGVGRPGGYTTPLRDQKGSGGGGRSTTGRHDTPTKTKAKRKKGASSRKDVDIRLVDRSLRPPKNVKVAEIDEFTGGAVQVVNGAKSGIESFYLNNAGLRKAFWRQVLSIARNGVRGLIKLQSDTNVWRARIGKFRMFIRVEGSGKARTYKVVKFAHRREAY